MGPVEIVIVIAAVLIVASVIGYSIYKKVTGKSTDCGCGSAYGCNGCQGCPHQCQTPSKQEENK